MKIRSWTAAAVAAMGSLTWATAEEVTLKVGDASPALQVAEWVQGDPVNEFEAGKAYLVEFWATWCGPCLTSIPHLNQLHEKYKDRGLVVIGQNVWESDETKVAPFVEEMGDKMSYRVALDDKKGNERGKMAATWMDAAGRNGIPSAFLVGTQGKVAWIGHPMSLKDALIEQVLAGSLNLDEAAAAYDLRVKNEEQMGSLWNAFNTDLRSGNSDSAEQALTRIEALTPKDERDGLRLPWFHLKLTSHDYDAAYQIAREASDAYSDNAGLQNALAWAIATQPGLEVRDLDLAEKIALRANEAAQGEDPSIVDTLARVLFMTGRQEEAIALQKKAVELAADRQKPMFQETLASYRDGKVPGEN